MKTLNVEKLAIVDPIFDSYDDSKFKALYEGISQSNVLSLVIRLPMIRVQAEMPILSFPQTGIEKLSLSKELKLLDVQYSYENNESPLFPILQALPANLKSLTVNYCKLIRSWSLTKV